VKPAGSHAAVGTLDSERVARSIAILQGADAIPAGMTPEQIIDFKLAPKA
jgi:NitT/TauT family transport system substrate-binding protein